MQLARIEVGSTPVDLTDGLSPGRYLAQPRSNRGERALLYATAETAPANDDDWFLVYGAESFGFTVSRTTSLPTWAKAAGERMVPVALAMSAR